jgi:hypothetical protein
MLVRDEAMSELIATLNQVHSTAPTWCAGWSAHDSHSEAVLHRWDLVGDDDTSVRRTC